MKFHTWLLWEEPGEGCARSRAMQHQQAKHSPTRAQPLQPTRHRDQRRVGVTFSQPVSAMLGGKMGTVHSKRHHLLPLPHSQHLPRPLGENPSQSKGGQIRLPAITLHRNTAWHVAISISPSSFFSILSPSKPSQPTGITAGWLLRQVQPKVPLSRGSLWFCGEFTCRAVMLQPGWAPRIPRGAGGSGGFG